MQIVITKNDKTFSLVFDDELILDTVHRLKGDKEPVQLNGANRDVQFFVRHQHELVKFRQVKGVAYINVLVADHSGSVSL